MLPGLALMAALLPDCYLPAYAGAYRFDAFPVAPSVVAKPAPPDLTTRRARTFRTQLRSAAKQPPDFAGHHRVATWGCGTCCIEFAIIDLVTGAVWFPSFAMTCGFSMSIGVVSDVGLFYCPDSELFVAVGSRNERDLPAVYYYRWVGSGLKLLATGKVPPASLPKP